MVKKSSKQIFALIMIVLGIVFIMHALNFGLIQIILLGFLTNISLALNFILAGILALKL
jgi:hypothetical protein